MPALDATTLDDSPADQSSDGGLTSPSFVALLVTQFLGAVNDNMFRWLSIGIGKEFVSDEQAATVLSAGLACFVAPYLVLAAPAGYLADRFSKRKVIIACKAAEVLIMALGIAAILIENVYLLFAVILMMGSQSALFGPSKLGSIPEMLRPQKISAANGILGLTTVIATVAGGGAGMMLYQYTQSSRGTDWWMLAAALVGVAVFGLAASVGIARLRPADPRRRFPFNAPLQTWLDMKALATERAMLRVALGIAFFWSLGSLCNLNIDQFAFEGGLNQGQVAPLLAALVVGVGLGSVLAGIWSGGHVEQGILPLGAGGIALFSILLFTVSGDLIVEEIGWSSRMAWACLWLFLLGTSAGLFDVPLAAYMQHRSPPESRGSILAASNFLTFGGMLAIAWLYNTLRQPTAAGEPLFSAREIFLLAGLFTVPVFLYVIWLLPQATIRFCVWLASHTVYRVTVHDRENLPKTGGALLVANHVSWLDGVLLLITSSRPIRMLAYARYVNAWWLRWLSRTMKVIPIDGGPKAIRAALETARQAVRDGELVCIFPEGSITRSGFLQRFKPGLLKIVEGTGAPVVPVYLDGLWGSIFSYHGGRFFWKWPRKWPFPVSIVFGKPIEHPEDVQAVRHSVEALGVAAVEKRRAKTMNLPLAFLTECRQAGGRSKVADTAGTDLTGRQLLIRTLILRRLLLRELLAGDEKYVGLLLPPSAGGVIVNAALTLCGRVPVNLNYTVSSEVMNNCIGQCGIKHVLTSRKVMEKLDLEIDADVVCLEDFREKVTTGDKIAGALGGYVWPLGMLAAQLGVKQFDPDDVFTVIFTSGSTGEPKGVMLTGKNVASNVAAVNEVVHLTRDDVVVGILPFFHSFGFTITMWTVLTIDPKGIYHFNPLDARQVGKLCEKHKATILLSTPTFLRSYLRRCDVEQLKTLDVVVTGAERLPVELADAFEKKFGVRPVEGYGTTELAPLVSVNIPPSRAHHDPASGMREGTVGRPIPNVMAKLVDPETGADIEDGGQAGMLLIKGPNVMKGYLNKPEKTAEVIRDGWYVTGDIAKIDEDGFIQITGRESRFSKIGGEMVPHVRIEEVLAGLLTDAGADQEEEEVETQKIAVTAVPDAKKGERLVVMHLPMQKTPDQLCKGLQSAGLPPIWIPSADSFCEVGELPLLGTGKLDLKGIKQLALEKFGVRAT